MKYFTNNELFTEKHFGFLKDSKLKFTDHINEKVNEAYGMLGIVKRNFGYMLRNCLVMLYKAMVRSHLEYANAVWNPLKKGHIDFLDKVQKRFTKMIPDLAHLEYSERLNKQRPPTLEYRHDRVIQINYWQLDSMCMPGLNQHIAEALSTYDTRGHRFKLKQLHYRYNFRQHIFYKQICVNMEQFDRNVVVDESVNVFKA